MNLADRSNYTIQRKKERVLLLSMSTLHYPLMQHTYVWQEKGWYFKGVSQLEADSKLIASLLDERNERIDKVIILATNAACEEKNLDGENVPVENTDVEKYSAVDFYIQRMKEFYGKPVKREYAETWQTNNIYTEHKIHNCKFPEFEPISVENENFLFQVRDVIGLEEDKDIELYLELQGGYRSTITKMDAVLKLLSSYGVKIKGRYINLFSDKRETPHPIKEVSEEYVAYDLATAMETFRKYGRGDELENFFKDRNDIIAKEIVSVLKEASDAIQLCEIDRFDKAINRLAELNEQKEQGLLTITDSLFEYVYDEIISDYTELIQPNLRYVEQIRWCLRKNYMQQALTILEAQMPTQYVVSGLKYYCNDENKKQSVLQYFQNLYLQNKQKREDGNKKTFPLFKMIDLNHFFICDYWSSVNVKYGYTKTKVDDNIKIYKSLKDKRNSINHVERHNPNGFFAMMQNQYTGEAAKEAEIYDKTWEANNEDRDQLKDEIVDYLNEFEKLAQQVPANIRNNVLDLA